MYEQIKQILMNINPNIDYDNEKHLISHHLLESLEMVHLLMELSEAFDVEISPLDVEEENFESIEAMVDFIKNIDD